MRVVIKVGTSLIAPGGQIDANQLRTMVDQLDLSKNEYLIVTSARLPPACQDWDWGSAPAMFRACRLVLRLGKAS